MWIYIGIAAFSQLFFVGGQLLLKQAMVATNKPGAKKTAALRFAGAIGIMSIWYFMWLFCKQHMDVSYQIVLEGISPMLLSLAAVFILRERVGVRTWLAVALISAGIIVATWGSAK
jgi:drug/metabolite transporter (DMT)-like permease